MNPHTRDDGRDVNSHHGQDPDAQHAQAASKESASASSDPEGEVLTEETLAKVYGNGQGKFDLGELRLADTYGYPAKPLSASESEVWPASADESFSGTEDDTESAEPTGSKQNHTLMQGNNARPADTGPKITGQKSAPMTGQSIEERLTTMEATVAQLEQFFIAQGHQFMTLTQLFDGVLKWAERHGYAGPGSHDDANKNATV